MRHCIIVKFKDRENWRKLLPEIKNHFDKALEVEGISSVKLYDSCSTRENRFHLMIELTMTDEGLLNFDKSDVHLDWKKNYGDMLESKTIFDYERG
ncbi:hypothetical protein [Treponema zioleckii]|uniref:hypothetical protein n=1 Tax=Treponema zioleckii TaxID=331680 RepID=UPI00168BE55B|nr:hypothetical protein [Treponema zioleckii]